MNLKTIITELKGLSVLEGTSLRLDLPFMEGNAKQRLSRDIDEYCTTHATDILDLSSQELTPHNLQSLFEILKTNKTVKTLRLAKLNPMADYHLRRWAGADYDPSPYDPPSWQLDYSKNPFNQAAINALDDLLRHNTTLTALNLSDNALIRCQATQLFMALATSNSALTELNLDDNYIIPDTIFSLALIQTKKLERLSLKANNLYITDVMTAIIVLLKQLHKNSSLLEVNLDGNPFLYSDANLNECAKSIADEQKGSRPVTPITFLGAGASKRPVLSKILTDLADPKKQATVLGQVLKQSPLPFETVSLISDYLDLAEEKGALKEAFDKKADPEPCLIKKEEIKLVIPEENSITILPTAQNNEPKPVSSYENARRQENIFKLSFALLWVTLLGVALALFALQASLAASLIVSALAIINAIILCKVSLPSHFSLNKRKTPNSDSNLKSSTAPPKTVSHRQKSKQTISASSVVEEEVPLCNNKRVKIKK